VAILDYLQNTGWQRPLLCGKRISTRPAQTNISANRQRPLWSADSIGQGEHSEFPLETDFK
jgi:hypothetical protein